MKEVTIQIPDNYDILDIVRLDEDRSLLVMKKQEPQLPKSWEEFCEMYPLPLGFAKVKTDFDPYQGYLVPYYNRLVDAMGEFTTDRATAEAFIALCQLIHLRNAYNGDWVPDWNNAFETKHCVFFEKKNICSSAMFGCPELLYFKNAELRDEFLRNFRPLIEKLKPLYGIKEGGQK